MARLNLAIRTAVAGGDQPNDLMDRRDQLLDKLSSLAQVSVTDLGDGSISLSFGDAANPIVDGSQVNWPQEINLAGPPPSSSGGKLAALQDVFAGGGTIDSLRRDLSAVAKDLADHVNALHNPGGTGHDFFSYSAGQEAGTLAVAVTAAGLNTSSGAAAAGNDIALAISRLRGGSTDSLYTVFVTRVGSMTQSADRQASSAQALTAATDLRRESTSGVSLDEEMTDLVRFQRAYQASARVMSTIDALLDTLINHTGRVGT